MSFVQSSDLFGQTWVGYRAGWIAQKAGYSYFTNRFFCHHAGKNHRSGKKKYRADLRVS